ncbi:MAG: type II toxin-antitoxin system RelE/ParE family toxin [Candidatus Woesearchaeota archaeon]|nr:type II toxin-antitoxin system RelE/ParE family toxin [Candidatus Woesearchaeota archaeon]
MYNIEIKPSCQESIGKHCKKDPVLREALENKMNEIVQNPQHYKPLRYGLAGKRRVHIMKSFVLKFEINESAKTVEFVAFDHHDDAYKR